LRAAAPVAPNCQRRCLEELGYSNLGARADLPVRVFGGADDECWKRGKPFFVQTAAAEAAAAQHGYRPCRQTVPGKGHEPLAEEVLAWFSTRLR
jgi:hypothetical protein